MRKASEEDTEVAHWLVWKQAYFVLLTPRPKDGCLSIQLSNTFLEYFFKAFITDSSKMVGSEGLMQQMSLSVDMHNPLMTPWSFV